MGENEGIMGKSKGIKRREDGDKGLKRRQNLVALMLLRVKTEGNKKQVKVRKPG